MNENSLSTITNILVGIVFIFAQFPGGTILMAVSCKAYKLDGWDWVFSVIIPFYGIIKTLFC